MLEINIREVQDGYIYKIDGLNKNGGEGVRKKTEEIQLLEKIAEAILSYKVKIERR